MNEENKTIISSQDHKWNKPGLKFWLLNNVCLLTTSLSIIGGIAIWFITNDDKLLIEYVIMTLIYNIIIGCTVHAYGKYVNSLLYQLSDLLESLIAEKDIMMFSDVEENVLSKLQNQVMKLKGILVSKNEKLSKEKNHIKSLISDISHQIKTPVASLQMFCELLQDDNLSKEERQEYLEIINQSLAKLLFLTESIVKMSRLETGVIQIKKTKTSINDIILQAIKQVYPKAKQNGMEIIFNPEQTFELQLDMKWTTEAIFNILDNAVKYAKPGTEITIKIIKYEMYIRIDISNYGEKIEESEIPMIFKRFYRGRNTDQIEGAGIGLYLARSIIMDQGGYIKVTSKEKTQFSVFLQ